MKHTRWIALLGICTVCVISSDAAPALAATPDCLGAAVSAQPGTAAWKQRESDNLYCSREGQLQAENSPAFIKATQMMVADSQELALTDDNEWDPDPFRYPPLFWSGTRGRFLHIEFPGPGRLTLAGFDVTRPFGWRDNLIYGQLLAPLPQCVRRATCPRGVPTHPAGPYPAIVLQPGTAANANQLTFLGEELAEHGYVCLITSYFNSSAQNITALRAGLNYMLSTPSHPDADGYVNPLWQEIDPTRVGVIGHSQGGGSAAEVGFSDPRVKALVLLDPYFLSLDHPPSLPSAPGQSLGDASGLAALQVTKKPTIIFSVDYTAGFSGPYTSAPSPESRNYPLYTKIAAIGADTMEVALRAATHQDLSQTVIAPGLLDYLTTGKIPPNPDDPLKIPLPRLLSETTGAKVGRPAYTYSLDSQQVMAYYTLAWLNRYVAGISDPSLRTPSLRELIASHFDGSVDSSSIGTGTYDAAKAKTAGNVLAGNVPIKLAGMSVANRLSFYYLSHYQLDGGVLTCADMRTGILAGSCPTTLATRKITTRRRSR